MKVAILSKIKLFNNLFSQRATTALGKNSLFSEDFHASHEAFFFRFSIFCDSKIFGGNTLDMSLVTIKNVWAWSACDYIDSHLWSFICHPPGKLAQGDDVIAVIIDGFREQNIWNFYRTVLAIKEIEVVWNDLCLYGGSILLPWPPTREKLVEGPGFEAVATEDVIAYFCSFFEEADRNGSSSFLFFLFEFDSGR